MKTVIRPFLRFVRKISFINSRKVKCIPCNINCHSVLGDILQTSKRLEITETRKKTRKPLAKKRQKVVDSVVEFCLYFKVLNEKTELNIAVMVFALGLNRRGLFVEVK